MGGLWFEIKVDKRLKYGEITNYKRHIAENKFKIEVPIHVIPRERGAVSFDTSIGINVEVYNIK
jgi:hypothetical protein